MTPTELSEEVATTVALAQSRIKSIGSDQYFDPETSRQKFEDMPLDALLEYAEEECLDLINYAVMVRIRYSRLREAIEVERRAYESVAGEDDPDVDQEALATPRREDIRRKKGLA